MTGMGRMRIAACEIIMDILLLRAHHTPGSVPSARPGSEVCMWRQHPVLKGTQLAGWCWDLNLRQADSRVGAVNRHHCSPSPGMWLGRGLSHPLAFPFVTRYQRDCGLPAAAIKLVSGRDAESLASLLSKGCRDGPRSPRSVCLKPR